MTDDTNNTAGSNCQERLVLWATRLAERLTVKIERRNMRIALRAVCHAQVWLRRLGHTDAANAMEEPIREIAKATIKHSAQNVQAMASADEKTPPKETTL